MPLIHDDQFEQHDEIAVKTKSSSRLGLGLNFQPETQSLFELRFIVALIKNIFPLCPSWPLCCSFFIFLS